MENGVPPSKLRLPGKPRVVPTGFQADPKGAQATAGQISFSETLEAITINQATPRGTIHWQGFPIGVGELTQFQHTDSRSATLNRVVGGIPSSMSTGAQVLTLTPDRSVMVRVFGKPQASQRQMLYLRM